MLDNFSTNDTILIWATGYSVRNYSDSQIKDLQSKFKNIYINRFPEFYPTQNNGKDYWIWCDYGFYTNNFLNKELLDKKYLELSDKIKDKRNFARNYNIVTTFEIYEKELNKGYYKIFNGKKVCENNYIPAYYLFNAVSNNVQFEKNNKLLMYKTTLHCAINFAIVEGYKNVILFGVDLNTRWNHFYEINDPVNYDKIFKPQKRINSIYQRLELLSKEINIFVPSYSQLKYEKTDI